MDKKTTIKDRILSFIEEQGIKKSDFYEASGIQSSNFKGKNIYSQPGGEMLVKILTLYPKLSADWLLTGEGSMLKTTHDDSSAELKPIVSYDPSIGIPYYDVDFAAGFDLMFNDQTVNPTANIVVYGFEKAKIWCNVTGDSMYPKICHGDMIALRECRPDDVLYGEIYAVVLDNIRTVKILRKAKDPTMLRFIPINTEKYDEQEFEKSRIIRIFEVLGNISRFI